MSLREFAELFPKDAALTLVDAGSEGGIHARRHAFAPILCAVGFDPRERERKGELSGGVSSPRVAVDRLDAVAARDGFTPDVLKIDTQGSEGSILDGTRNAVERPVVAAEIEISFMERWQAIFDDANARMKAASFRLVDLMRLKRHRSLDRANVSLGFGQRAGSLSGADATFVRRDEFVLDRAQQDGGLTLLRAMAAMIAYGKPDIAARFFDRGESLVAPELRPVIANALRGLAKLNLGLRKFHIVADRLARRV